MGQAVSRQQPAVVLRSQFNMLRALLAVAALAVVGLTVAVVILANDSDEVSSTGATGKAGSVRYGEFNPATGRPESAPLPQLENPPQNRIDGTRYDGGPEEGTRGILKRPAPATFDPNSIKEAPGVRYDGGPEEGTRGIVPAPSPTTGDLGAPGSELSKYGTSQYRLAPGEPGTQLSGEAQEARTTDPHGPASATP
jgi:hypothetical protein